MTTTKLPPMTLDLLRRYALEGVLVARTEINLFYGDPRMETCLLIGYRDGRPSHPRQRWVRASFSDWGATAKATAVPVLEIDLETILGRWFRNPGWETAKPMVVTLIEANGVPPTEESPTSRLMMQHWASFRSALNGIKSPTNYAHQTNLAHSLLGSWLDAQNRQVGLETLLKD